MGHVAAQVVSSNTVSLSLVSSIFERFLSSDSGTSPEVFACLKRSAAAVDELIQAEALKSKGGAERAQHIDHKAFEKKAPHDRHSGSEAKKQLGLEGDIINTKTGSKPDKLGKVGRREQEGHSQNIDVDKRQKSKHSRSEAVGTSDTLKDHRDQKREKNQENLDGSDQPNALERDSSKEEKEMQDKVLNKEHGKKHKKHHKTRHVLDHDMPKDEIEKEIKEREEPSKRDKRYQQVQEVVQVEDPTADMVNEETGKKKRKKKIGEGEDGSQEDEHHRGKKRRRQEKQDFQQ
ncbi:unnamed protein product [Victoria cruziana]